MKLIGQIVVGIGIMVAFYAYVDLVMQPENDLWYHWVGLAILTPTCVGIMNWAFSR